jgi:hypothetical protein
MLELINIYNFYIGHFFIGESFCTVFIYNFYIGQYLLCGDLGGCLPAAPKSGAGHFPAATKF